MQLFGNLKSLRQKLEKQETEILRQKLEEQETEILRLKFRMDELEAFQNESARLITSLSLVSNKHFYFRNPTSIYAISPDVLSKDGFKFLLTHVSKFHESTGRPNVTFEVWAKDKKKENVVKRKKKNGKKRHSSSR